MFTEKKNDLPLQGITEKQSHIMITLSCVI